MMLTTTCFDFATKQKQQLPLPESVFGVAPKSAVIHHVVTGYLAQRRCYTRQVKDRSQVQGGGRKPWKQKGQGRARHGSIRSPIWRGGGVVFGPQATQHARFKVNRRCYRSALKMILSHKFASKQLFIVKNLTCPTGKTKSLQQTLTVHSTPLLASKTLLVSDNWPLAVRTAAHNLSNLTVTTAHHVHPYQLLGHQFVVVTATAVPILVDRVTS